MKSIKVRKILHVISSEARPACPCPSGRRAAGRNLIIRVMRSLGALRLEMTLFLIFVFLFQALTFAGEPRYSYVAGAFYPSDKEELSSIIDGFLSKAPEAAAPPGELKALIVPHAGYIYSGQTAAYSYKLLQHKHFDTVILLGPYHKGIFSGASIWKKGPWETPLGRVPVDETLAQAIANESSLFNFTQDAHSTEHSLETQVPFLQKVLKDFKIVPILVSDPSPDNTGELAGAIYKHIQNKNVLVVVSTDMSHYHEDPTARRMDGRTLELIQKMDGRAILRGSEMKTNELCGLAATLTLLDLAKLMGNTKVELLNYSTSADTTQDVSRVVGYGAFSVYETDRKNILEEGLTVEQGRELVRIARQTVDNYVSTGKIPEITVTNPVLAAEGASFVTLKKNGQLRGCIGTLAAREPLYLSVRNMAIQSASSDRRFEPVKPEELKDIKVEISVLSMPKKVKSADEIQPGRHGVILKNSFASGVFLPKVAEETGWSKEELLSELCSQKAGLPRDCWQDPATELYTFTSQDFSE